MSLKARLNGPHVCLITDPARPDLLEKIERALAAGVTMLHLRGHMLPAADLYALAQVCANLCKQYGALFMVNDRIDVGLAVGADGFQLGARSLPLAIVRQLIGKDALLGASVHSLDEASKACADGADFLLAGTIFVSPSHPGGSINGPRLLRQIKKAYPSVPLLAIGGITSANASQAVEAGADGLAVISAIFEAPNIEHEVRQLCSALERGGKSGALPILTNRLPE